MKTLYYILAFAIVLAISSCDGCRVTEADREKEKEGSVAVDTPKIDPINIDSEIIDSIKISPNKLVLQFPEWMSEADKAALRAEAFATKDSTCSCGNSLFELWKIDTTKIDIEEAKRKTASSDGSGGVRGDRHFFFSVPDPGIMNPSTDLIVPDEIEGGTRNILGTLTGVTNGTGNRVNIAVVDTGLDFSEQIQMSRFLYDASIVGMDCGGEYEHYSGWNFVDNNADITDNHSDGHGTFVTKTLISELNTLGIPYSILPVKAFGENGSGSYWNIVCALNYIKEIQEKKGDLHIVNASFGYSFHTLNDAARRDSLIELQKESILASLIDELKNSTLIVASAGNDDLDTDESGKAHFPSGFTAPNLIGVGGYTLHKTTPTNVSRTLKGNFGKISIDLAAPYQIGFPGESPSGQPENMLVKSGTSYGTPLATAKIARFISEGNDNQMPLAIKNAFLGSLEIQQNFTTDISGGGYIETDNPIIIDFRPVVLGSAGANSTENP